MAKDIVQIYDKMMKKILTMSSKAVVNLINGLFDTEYPTDSILSYNWTEFVDDELRKILADTIITVENAGKKVSYHIEAQMTEDGSIVFRMMEYGFGHAQRNRFVGEDGFSARMVFPEPKIVYLYSEREVPGQYVLTLDFGTQGTFEYHVPVMKLLETSFEELNEKKMAVLLPFMLLKLRKSIEQERTEQNLSALQRLVDAGIMEGIKENLEAGNITEYDYVRLARYTKMLYDHLYSGYEEMEGLNSMMDESFMTDVDIMIRDIERLEEEVEEIKKEKEEAEKQKEEIEKQKEEIEKEKTEFERQKNTAEEALVRKDSEIAELKRQLEKMRACR